MASRKKQAPQQDAADPPAFEQSLEELESLVEAMESEQLPLEKLVAHYEKGSRLLHHCQQLLESARERIELITLDNSGESALEHAASRSDVGSAAALPTAGDSRPPTAGDSRPPSQGPDPDDDDIRLF